MTTAAHAQQNALAAADELLTPIDSTWYTLRPCVTQSILSNIFLGLAQGALAEGRGYTLGLDRPFSGSSVRPAEDPYIVAAYGDMHVLLAGAGVSQTRRFSAASTRLTSA